MHVGHGRTAADYLSDKVVVWANAKLVERRTLVEAAQYERPCRAGR